MPTFLSDPSPTLFGFLAIMVIALALLYIRSRKRGDLFRLLIGTGIAAAWVAIAVLVESPREESTRKLEEMAAGSRAKNINDVGRHMSESFHYNGMDKTQALQRFGSLLRLEQANGIDVAGFNRGDFEQIDDKTAKIGFEIWPTGYGLPDYRYFSWATFVKEPDGQFRLKAFNLYHPAKRPADDQKPVVPPQIQ